MESGFVCRRCGYRTDVKCNLLNHLSKYKICSPLLEDIERQALIDELVNKDVVESTCKFCNKDFSKRCSLYRHNKICKERLLANLQKECDKLREENRFLKENMNVTNNVINFYGDLSLSLKNPNISKDFTIENIKLYNKEFPENQKQKRKHILKY